MNAAPYPQERARCAIEVYHAARAARLADEPGYRRVRRGAGYEQKARSSQLAFGRLKLATDIFGGGLLELFCERQPAGRADQFEGGLVVASIADRMRWRP
jgi:hypothetical protein